MVHKIPHTKESKQKISETMKGLAGRICPLTKEYKKNLVQEYIIEYMIQINSIETRYIDTETNNFHDYDFNIPMKAKTLQDFRRRVEFYR